MCDRYSGLNINSDCETQQKICISCKEPILSSEPKTDNIPCLNCFVLLKNQNLQPGNKKTP